MASLLTRALLVLVCGFAALSSSAAVALGLAEERVLVFTGLLLALLALPLLTRPALARPSGPALLLALLLAGIVVTDAGGTFDPVDAKVALPVLVLLAGPNLARQLTPAELATFVWRLLSFYVAVTFLYQVVAEPAVVARGHERIVRYDPTGSVVMHSSLSLIHLVLAATRLGEPQPLRARLGVLALGGMSLSMVFLTATRTTLLTLTLLAVLTLLASPKPHRAGRRLAIAALGLGLAFAAWTLLVDDSFFLRLTGGQEDFTSGRWTSVRHWLALAGETPGAWAWAPCASCSPTAGRRWTGPSCWNGPTTSWSASTSRPARRVCCSCSSSSRCCSGARCGRRRARTTRCAGR
jgi:hypothetical protein